MWRLIVPLMICVLLASCTSVPLTVEQQNSSSAQSSSTGTLFDEMESESSSQSGSLLNSIPVQLSLSGAVEFGDSEAKHTVLAFLTPGSPYSAQFGQDVLPELLRTYIATEKIHLRIFFVPFKRYPQTTAATAQFLCAVLQGKGEQALPLLLTNPLSLGNTDLGVDKKLFSSCMKDPAILQTVRLQQDLAHSMQVTLVPTLFIDGEKHVGLPTWADLRGQIDQAL